MARKNIVLAVNLQWNYFSSNGTSFYEERSKKCKANILEYLVGVDLQENALIYTRNVRVPTDEFYSSKKTCCIAGTLDVNMIEGLPQTDHILVTATRPSAMWKTPLLSLIKKENPEKITLVGAETNSSILYTAEALRYEGYKVVVPESLVLSIDDYTQAMGISMLVDTLGVDVV